MTDTLTDIVRLRYAEAARRAAQGEKGACCGTGSTCGADPITSDLYTATETAELPAEVVAASLGCGNPTALATLREGEVVLDLGSGGGIDVLLSARRVGPSGKAYGLDMTDEMLELARRNQAAAGIDNVEFLQGRIEAIPLPDASVDVIISNCVINLSGDKARVLAEAFRVLKPGGRFAVSDVLTRGTLPEAVQRSMRLWTGCVAGALPEETMLAMLRDAGFVDATIEPTRDYGLDEVAQLLASVDLPVDDAPALANRVFSGFVRATRPE